MLRELRSSQVSSVGDSTGGTDDEQTSITQVEDLRAHIVTLQEDLARAKVSAAEMESLYRRESQLMLSAVHDLGMKVMREETAASASGTRAPPQSWLGQSRSRVNGNGLVRALTALTHARLTAYNDRGMRRRRLARTFCFCCTFQLLYCILIHFPSTNSLQSLSNYRELLITCSLRCRYSRVGDSRLSSDSAPLATLSRRAA